MSIFNNISVDKTKLVCKLTVKNTQKKDSKVQIYCLVYISYFVAVLLE